jgi:ElaB/YqjD/DUF883 family membrane-anchored ribosome-binding protein
MADNLTDAGVRMGEEVADDIRDAGKGGVKQFAGRAKQYAQQGYAYAADKSMQAKETAQSLIEEYPWYAVGIAVGVGIVLGMLLRGGRSREG